MDLTIGKKVVQVLVVRPRHQVILALRLPGDRPVRAGHRRVHVTATRRAGGAPFFEQAIGTTKVAPVEVVTTKDRDAAVIVAGHAFVQNVRRGHYELATGEPANRRLAVAFDELVMAI